MYIPHAVLVLAQPHSLEASPHFDKEDYMSIADWPAAERPREKLLDLGPKALSDAELLAIFLRVGCVGKSAVDLARELLQEYGGLRPLLEASQAEFCKGLGLGAAKYAQLQAVLEMGRRHLSASMKEGDLLSSPDLVRNYLSAQLRHQPQEIFAILFLDNQHRLIAYDEIFYGTIDGAAVYPREVVKKALARNAAACIFAGYATCFFVSFNYLYNNQ